MRKTTNTFSFEVLDRGARMVSDTAGRHDTSLPLALVSDQGGVPACRIRKR